MCSSKHILIFQYCIIRLLFLNTVFFFMYVENTMASVQWFQWLKKRAFYVLKLPPSGTDTWNFYPGGKIRYYIYRYTGFKDNNSGSSYITSYIRSDQNGFPEAGRKQEWGENNGKNSKIMQACLQLLYLCHLTKDAWRILTKFPNISVIQSFTKMSQCIVYMLFYA